MAFVSIAMYFFITASNPDKYKNQLKYSFLCLLFSTLAITSNFGAINFYISFWVLLIAGFILNQKKHKTATKYSAFGFFTLALIPVYFTIDRLFFLKSINQLYYGAEKLIDTVRTFITSSMYGLSYPSYYSTYILAIILLVITLGVFLYLYTIQKTPNKINFLLLFPIILLGYVIENYLFEAKFPMGRTALFLYPLFLFFVAQTINYGVGLKTKFTLRILGIALSALFFIHFYKSANVTHVDNWKYDSNTRQVMEYLKEIETKSSQKITLSNNWLFEPSINYYRDKYSLKLSKATRAGIDSNTTYIYDFKSQIDTNKYENLIEFEISETALFKVKKK